MFSYECTADNFGPDGIRSRTGIDEVVEPIVQAFRHEGRIADGRFVAGNTGAFWDRDHGPSVLPLNVLLRVKAL